MLWWFSKKSGEELAEKTEKGFSAVKKDIDSVGKWIKHLDSRDKQLFDIISTLKEDLSSLKDEIESLQEGLEIAIEQPKNKQVFKKLPVLDKQTTVEAVQKAVQTGVQTGSFYENLKGLTSNERLLVFTLMNNDMKLSYEDLAMLLGKDKSTVRGQINAIKQKREELIEEVIEKNGKKRVFVPDHLKEKLAKYAKVRGK
ncbi:hypothetical protein J4402_04835 [Candidatus Pacearchaeota archaeon]|nr:hypothetical protein [Candidatus Pacearchaeota archaeon]